MDRRNGLSLLYAHQLSSPQHVVVSDASGSWGCGAYSGRQWFQLCWSGSDVRGETIMVKELIPIVIAAAVWGRLWGDHTVQCKCDNQAVVAVICSRTAKLPMIMHLLRCLFFFEAHFNFTFRQFTSRGYRTACLCFCRGLITCDRPCVESPRNCGNFSSIRSSGHRQPGGVGSAIS